jgi:hypothetical protein
VWAKLLAGVVAATAAGGVVVHFTAPKRGVPPPRDAIVWLQALGPGGVDRRGQPVVLLPVDSVHRAMGSHVVGLAACVGPTAVPAHVHDRMSAERAAIPGGPSE